MSPTRIEKYRRCATCGHVTRQFAESETPGLGVQFMWLAAAIVFPVGLFLLLACPELLFRRRWTCTECQPEEY